MIGRVTVCLLVLFGFVPIEIVVTVQSVEPCPAFCACDIWYELQRTSCIGRHLYDIHTGASSAVQALDLSNNSISSLKNSELASAGLTRLKYLNLSGNSINEIGLFAFQGLDDLTVLDLSRNHLYYVLSYLFVDNKSLRILKLSKNNFISHVPDLWCSSLTELSLDSCRISHLPLHTFNGLPQLRNLDLSNNLMIQIDSAVLQSLHFLTKLSLHGNPWSCNKVMTDLQVNLTRRNVEFIQVCGAIPGPKKFEKMILRPITREEDRRHSTASKKKIEKIKYPPKNNFSFPLDDKDASTRNKSTNDRLDFVSNARDASPYLLLIAGFILGSATTMVACYVWLTANCRSCRRRRASHDQNDADSQRLSLLSSLWQYEDFPPNDNVDLVATCPGTPPPPYREVMLWPRPCRTSTPQPNLNDNRAGCRERCT